jgi:hypothetical protein
MGSNDPHTESDRAERYTAPSNFEGFEKLVPAQVLVHLNNHVHPKTKKAIDSAVELE